MKAILRNIGLLLLAAFVTSSANAQFTPGQILTAAQLNSALAGKAASASLSSASGAGLIGFARPEAGATARSAASKMQDAMSLLDFGADATGSTDSTTALGNFYAAVVLTGKAGYIPAGTYKISSQVTWDVAGAQNKGVKIYGDGPQSILDLSSVSAGPALLIQNSNNTGAFYSSFRGFAVRTNVNGVGVQVGQESFADAMNSFTFDLVVNNTNTGANTCAVELNYVLNSLVSIVANNSGNTVGDALRLRQAQFNTFIGSYSTALNGLHLTGGYTFANNFLAIDNEVVGTAVTIDSANATKNTWYGGQFVWATAGINASAGSFNRFIGTNFSTSSTIGTTLNGVVAYGTNYGTEQFGSIKTPGGIGAMPMTSTTGSNVIGPHMVQGSIALAAGTATVTLSGSAVFTSSTSFTCTANDSTAANSVRVNQASGTSITFTGTSTDTVQFLCAGN
jgi:hypothetical protein